MNINSNLISALSKPMNASSVAANVDMVAGRVPVQTAPADQFVTAPAPTPAPAPDPAKTGNLQYFGGGVLKHVHVVPVYLGDYFNTAAGEADKKHNNEAIENLVRNKNMTSIWAQYGVGKGDTGKSITLGGPAPTVVTQASLEAMIQQQIAAGKFDTSNPQTLFNFELPPGVELQNGADSSHAGLGGFHGSVTGPNGKEVYYAVNAYSQTNPDGSVNGIDFTGNPRDNVSITESHEITEAVTDPNVSVAIRNNDLSQLGWYDDATPWVRANGTPVLDSTGQPIVGKGEIGDIGILNSELDGDKKLTSAWGRLHGFAFQNEWSNTDNQEELRANHRHHVQPLPPPQPATPSSAGGTAIGGSDGKHGLI